MIFPFTFKFSVPGIINPFALSPSLSTIATSTGVDLQNQTDSVGLKTPKPRSRPLPETQTQQLRGIEGLRSQSITPPVLVSRKRGWEPAFAEESSPSTTLENSTGYLVTGMASEPAEYHEVVDTEDIPPPAKRRRGLAGSIVSTAISAALIGTAVGLTVYRLWRDRGKPESTIPANYKSTVDSSFPSTPERKLHALPPPPYQESERTPGQLSTPNKSRKRRPIATHSQPKRSQLHNQNSLSRQRSARARGHIPPTGLPSSQTGSDEIEHQMDWFGDKLSALIAEGKRALGREIVVMSDAKEDEVDDGSTAWEDSDRDHAQLSDSESRTSQRTSGPVRPRRRAASPAGSLCSPSRSSPRKARRHQPVVSHLSSASCSSSSSNAFGFQSTGPSTATSSAGGGYFEPQLSRHAYSASTSCLPNHVSSFAPSPQSLPPTSPAPPVTPKRTHSTRSYGLSLDSSSSPGWPCSEDLNGFDSPELRETMERARQRVLMMRASGTSLRGGEL